MPRSLVETKLREERDALRQAIAKIWQGHWVVTINDAGWERHVEPAIYEAVKLLPVEMRRRAVGEKPKKRRTRCLTK